MNTPVSYAILWAAISPPTKRGTRWIASWTVRHLKKEARAAFLLGGVEDWTFWRKRGWTVERVFVSAVQMVPSK